MHGRHEKTNAKIVGNPREAGGTSVQRFAKGREAPINHPEELAIAAELEGTGFQSLARGSGSIQEPTQKTSGFLGNRGEPASKPSHEHGKHQKTNAKNVGIPWEPEGTSVQSLTHAREASENECKNRREP